MYSLEYSWYDRNKLLFVTAATAAVLEPCPASAFILSVVLLERRAG